MSRSSLTKHKDKNSSHSSENESLPEYLPSYLRQWGSVQKRLEYLEETILKMQKRAQKTQKKLSRTEQELSSLKKELKRKIEEMFNSSSNEKVDRQRELQLQTLKEELTELHSFLKRIQKKNNEIIRQFKQGAANNFGGLDEGELQARVDQKIEEALEKNYQKNKVYIDRAVAEMKALVKQYARNQNQPLDSKTALNQLSRSLSKSRLSANQLSHKKISVSQGRCEPAPQPNQTSFQQRRKSKSPRNVEANGNSRVSYLREKLKEFQQINKKYDQKQTRTDKKTVPLPPQGQKRKVQIMKEFKNYLEQSQSQLEQSNLDGKQGYSDSMRKWKNNQKYFME